MRQTRRDASTSTDDDIKTRPLCLFYFTHPFGVLSPDPPLVITTPPFQGMRSASTPTSGPAPVPACAWHYTEWATSIRDSSYKTATSTNLTGDKLIYNLGNTTLYQNPVNIIEPCKNYTRDPSIERSSLSSSFLSDLWFNSNSSSASFNHSTRRMLRCNPVLPPLEMPVSRYQPDVDSPEDMWPRKCLNLEKFSLPPIELPRALSPRNGRSNKKDSTGKVSNICSASKRGHRRGNSSKKTGVDHRPSVCAGGIRKKRRHHGEYIGDVRRIITRLLHRVITGVIRTASSRVLLHVNCNHLLQEARIIRYQTSPGHEEWRSSSRSDSAGLQRTLAIIREAWTEPSYLNYKTRCLPSSKLTNNEKENRPEKKKTFEEENKKRMRKGAQVLEMPTQHGASPGLLRRRYSLPEIIMRKYGLAQQIVESECGITTSGSPETISPIRGSYHSLCNTPQRLIDRDRELMRKSALLRRMCGRSCKQTGCNSYCCCTGDYKIQSRCRHSTRSSEGSNSEFSQLPSNIFSYGDFNVPMGHELDGSYEILETSMKNNIKRNAECKNSNFEKMDIINNSSHDYDSSSLYTDDPTLRDVVTSPIHYDKTCKRDVFTKYSETYLNNIRYMRSDSTHKESKSVHKERVESETSDSVAKIDLINTPKSFRNPIITISDEITYKTPKKFNIVNESADSNSHINEQTINMSNNEYSVVNYRQLIPKEKYPHEILEIMISETHNADIIDWKKQTRTESPKKFTEHKPHESVNSAKGITLDEYVSNILIQSLNSLNDQLDVINSSIGNDGKLSVVEKEIKVKLQNTGVNTIVHLSPNSNNQIIFGNEELYNNENLKYNDHNHLITNESFTIRDEVYSFDSKNEYVPLEELGEKDTNKLDTVHKDSYSLVSLQNNIVHGSILEQIQRLFEDKFKSNANTVSIKNIPSISHIDISNAVNVYTDDIDPKKFIEENNTKIVNNGSTNANQIVSNVGVCNYFQTDDDNIIVPRLTAFPNSESMEVNASFSDDMDAFESDCTSLVDSLDDPNSPRSLLKKRHIGTRKMPELVRSAINVLDLLPENSICGQFESNVKKKGESFFIRIKNSNFDCEGDSVKVADHLPAKIRRKLYDRHKKRQLRMETSRRNTTKLLKREIEKPKNKKINKFKKENEKECMAIINALIDDLINKITQDEYKYMRIQRKIQPIFFSTSLDENFIKSKMTANTNNISYPNLDENEKLSTKKVQRKVYLQNRESVPTEHFSPKKLYQKSEIQDGDKYIEILEILECNNTSQNSSENSMNDEKFRYSGKSKKSRIPIPVYEKLQGTHVNSLEKIHREVNIENVSPVSSAVNNLDVSDSYLKQSQGYFDGDYIFSNENRNYSTNNLSPTRRTSIPYETRTRSNNSLGFRRVFDIIPEEKSSLSFGSSNDDINYNRRAFEPWLPEHIANNINIDKRIPNHVLDSSKENDSSIVSSREVYATNSINTCENHNSSLKIINSNSDIQKEHSNKIIMTSPKQRTTATSPLRSLSTSAEIRDLSYGKKGLSSPPRAWLGFYQPEKFYNNEAEGTKCNSKEKRTEKKKIKECLSGKSQCTVRTIQYEKTEPIIVGNENKRKTRRKTPIIPISKLSEEQLQEKICSSTSNSVKFQSKNNGFGIQSKSKTNETQNGDHVMAKNSDKNLRKSSANNEKITHEAVNLQDYRFQKNTHDAGNSSESDSDSASSFMYTLSPKSPHSRRKILTIQGNESNPSSRVCTSRCSEKPLITACRYPLLNIGLPNSGFPSRRTGIPILWRGLQYSTRMETDSYTPQRCDVLIYDGFFMLHALKDVPSTFGNISKKLIQMFTKNNARIIIITFDRYFSPSIKDNEHLLRGRVRGQQYRINGPDQVRPANFASELKNMYFKAAFVEFLRDDWENNYMASFMGEKTIYINDEFCYKFEVQNNNVVRTIDDNLSCPAHEEADTKIVFHVCKLHFDAHVTIRCSDTDIAIIMLGNMNAVQKDLNITMHIGTGNSQRFINITNLYEKLGANLCSALPGFHALTGCDFNPALYRKGKNKPFQLLRKSEAYMRALSSIRNIPNCKLDEVFPTIEEFVCRVYGFKGINDVNATRVATFLQNYQIVEHDDLLNWKKRIDGAIFPPCHSELRQHLLRTSYIAHLWSRAHRQDPTELSPTDWGWEEREGKYGFKWFEGDQVPPTITSITDSSENIADNGEEDRAADIEQDEEHDIAEDSSDDDTSQSEYDSDSTIDDE